MEFIKYSKQVFEKKATRMFGTTTEENGKGFYTEQFGKFDEIHKIIIEAMSGRHSKKNMQRCF